MRSIVNNLTICFGTSLLLFVATARCQQPPRKLDAVRTSGQADQHFKAVSYYFPFHAGDEWTYEVHGSEDDDSSPNTRVEALHGRFTERVVEVRTVAPAVQIVQMRRTGKANAYIFCTPEQDSGESVDYWYIFDRRNIYVRCQASEAKDLASKLVSGSGPQGDDGPEFVLPLVKGKSWGQDRELPPRNDLLYEWTVEDTQSLAVPAGKFKGCVETAYRTLSSNESRWVCPRIGLAASEIESHGSGGQYRIELVAFSGRSNAQIKKGQ